MPTTALPTTLEEAHQLILQLQAERADLKQQVADLTAQQGKTASKKTPPPVKSAVPRGKPQTRRKRDPQHN
ncbi:MAG: hypothetical protein HC837_21145, partial [Chloroflexaceae bacterium]|nr:hypothetical protein [Chloroflexaceae bacterium]